MANRIVQNVIIVDSAMGNSILTDRTKLQVNSVALSMADTSATLTLTGADTTDALVILNKYIPLIHFSNPQYFNTLKVPVCSAGTAWVYLA